MKNDRVKTLDIFLWIAHTACMTVHANTKKWINKHLLCHDFLLWEHLSANVVAQSNIKLLQWNSQTKQKLKLETIMEKWPVFTCTDCSSWRSENKSQLQFTTICNSSFRRSTTFFRILWILYIHGSQTCRQNTDTPKISNFLEILSYLNIPCSAEMTVNLCSEDWSGERFMLLECFSQCQWQKEQFIYLLLFSVQHPGISNFSLYQGPWNARYNEE